MADSVNDAATIAAIDRRRAVEQLFLDNFDFIQEAISSDPTLRFETSDKMAQALANRLCDYRGPLTDADFRQWVADVILPAVSFATIYETCAGSVRDAIRKVFATCLDLGIDPSHYKDAEQATWLWTWEHLDELRDPAKSKAKTKTRLYAVAKFQALSIRKSLLRAKERTSNIALERIGTNANEFEYSGLVIEPRTRETFDPYERLETMQAAA